MATKEIYDRIELCDNIISCITELDETQAYILYSGTGVGKSSVSKKIAKLVIERGINKDIIRIKSTQDSNFCEGTFLSNIFQNIRRYYLLKNSKEDKAKRKKYKKYSYRYYIRLQNFTVFKKLMEDTRVESCNNIREVVFHFFKLLFNFISIKIGVIKDLETNFDDNKTLINYIKYILKKGNIVLCIENAQNIDKTSLDALMELFIETKQCPNYVIFEFTLSDNSENLKLLENIKNELDYSEIAYKISELNKLDIKYVLELAKQCNDSADGSFILTIEQMYTGNVKKVENFAFNYSLKTICDADPTLVLLQSLSKNQKYIMAVIILNNAVIAEQLLKQILNNSNGIYLSNYNKDIEYLIDNARLLEKRDKSICVKDKDTIESWCKNNEAFKIYEALAYKNCDAILLRILENGIEYSLSRRECILLLLQLYSRFDAMKLNDILKYIDEVIYEIISIDELEKYLKKLLQVIYVKRQSLQILFNIFDICNRHQLVELESNCLHKISNILKDNVDEKYLFCYYTNLLHREEYQYLLTQIEGRENCNIDLNFKYYIELFKIVAHASLNHREECYKIVKILENDLAFQASHQYGYLLRLAEAYAKRNIAIPKVEKSVIIFSKFAMDTQAAKSQVSLSFLYSITGNLVKAKEALDSAEKILLKNIENKHVFNINKACLCLLQHNYTEEVWNLLSESEKYAYIRFDKIAIIINKLIWCIENQEFGKGRYYEKKGLELLELEYNHHLHAIFYYNCYVLYKSMDNIAISQKYYDLAVNYKEYCDTLKARLENKKEVEDQTTFLLQYPWHVCFVSYWYFDYELSDKTSTFSERI